MSVAGEYNLYYWWDGAGESPVCNLVINADHTFSMSGVGWSYNGKWMEQPYDTRGFYPPVLRLNTPSCTTYVTNWFNGPSTDPAMIGGGMTNYDIRGTWRAERIVAMEERDETKPVLDANGVEITPENK